jgi:hypothetical protein
MNTFIKAGIGALAGKLIAALFIAICATIGLGPEKWAAFLVEGLPNWVTPDKVRIAFLILASLVFYFLIASLRKEAGAKDVRQNTRDTTEHGGERTVADEHFKVAQELNNEHPGRTFTAAKFYQLYRKKYPNRNEGSIMPADYSLPSAPSVNDRAKFLKKSGVDYVFTGLVQGRLQGRGAARPRGRG